MQGLVEEMGNAVPYVEIDASKNTARAREYRIQAVPTIVVLDASGSVVKTFVGTPSKAELRAAMEKASGS
ncbi:MAG: thioredoxin family protein [Actinobacteria bacterium]|nr:thioredoxin family protein [Actinomycetota bacterium]